MLNIAIGQMDVRAGQRKANLADAWRLADQAREAQVDILLLPELWLDGYDLEHADTWATELGTGGFAEMAAIARASGLYVAGSLMERHAEGISNTAVFVDPTGEILGSYRKIHLFRLMQEQRYLVPGDHVTLCQTPWGPVGLAICYDLRFPEMFRTLALAGAVMFLIPAQWPVRRIDTWILLLRARAIENEMVVAACNRVGVENDVVFPGRSAIVDPWGHTLVECDDQPGLFVAQVNLDEIKVARRYMTVYEDRRPDAYHIAGELNTP